MEVIAIMVTSDATESLQTVEVIEMYCIRNGNILVRNCSDSRTNTMACHRDLTT